jgi:N-acetylneuraminic acid mutarotase
VLLLAFALGLLAAAPTPKYEPLPAAVSNNAVTLLKLRKETFVYSLMGIGSKKTWDAITNMAYALDLAGEQWAPINPVPGTAGRIAASAAGAQEHVYLIGGYVVDAQGEEHTLSDVNVYDPPTGRWYRGEDTPVAVDDAVIGVYRDRYIYLVSGWSKTQSVKNVQVYDAVKNVWQQATPIPGTGVFGHAGALVDDTIVYIDGAYANPAGTKPKYIASDECWMGKIDHHDISKIQWTKLPGHPGTARYRIAGGGSEKDQKIYFTGGTDNPYNYNGVGYDGRPAEPSAVTFAFNLRSSKWETISDNTPTPTMDHRGVIALPRGLLVIGGMEAGQQVTNKVVLLPKEGAAK